MAEPRLDSVEHLIADLRKAHPRLVLLVGEHHDSIETRRLYCGIAKNADVGFFEATNSLGLRTGTPADTETIRRKMAERAHSQNAINTLKDQTLLAPRHAIFVDEPIEAKKGLSLAEKALNRLEKDRVPADSQIAQSVAEIAQYRAIERVRRSNPIMADTIANHLDEYYPGNTPFFASLLVGSGHLRDLDTHGLEHTPSDLRHALQARGFTTVSLDIEPCAPAMSTQKPGTYLLEKECTRSGIDYTISVIDPATRHARRGR